jgi:hypothetical protein
MTKIETTASESASTQWQFVRFFLLCYFAVFGLMLLLYISKFGMYLSTEHDRWGQFGDFLGGILNPLTSFFTLIVAVFVWRLQSTELAETRKVLQEQIRINQLAVADEMLMHYLDAIMICINQIKSKDLIGDSTRISHGDHAIEATVNTLKSLGLQVGKIKNIDDESASNDFILFTVEQLTPLQNAIRSTAMYIEKTYDDSTTESKFELLRLRLSLFTQLYLCYFIGFTKDTELLAISRRADLLKYFPAGSAKDWIYTKATF